MFDDLQYLQDREKCKTLIPTFEETWKQETDRVKAKQQQRLVGSSRMNCVILVQSKRRQRWCTWTKLIRLDLQFSSFVRNW